MSFPYSISSGGHDYVILSALDTFSQLKIARKLAPATPVVEGLVNPENRDKNKELLTVMALANISDDDVDLLIKLCLTNIVRRSPSGDSKIQTPSGQLQFDDITLKVLMELTVKTIELNVGDFFHTALVELDKEATKLQGT